MMAKLYLIRHGVTDWNRERRFQGQTDIPLAADGLAQAQKLGAHFQKVVLAAVYSSDLSRAWQTAQPIAQACACPLVAETGLRERAFGVFEGLTHDTIVSEHAQQYQRWRSREPDFAITGGGESLRALHGRVLAVMTRLAQQHQGDAIALVTHGGVLDCAYRIAGGLALADPSRPNLLNAAINVVRYRPQTAAPFTIESWGDVAHLG